MKKRILLILAILLIFNIQVFATDVTSEGPIRDQNILVPTDHGVDKATYEEAVLINNLSEKSLENLTTSYLLGDFETGVILEAYNIDEVRGMASTSKLVSVYVALDAIKAGRISYDDEVVMDKESSSILGSTYESKEGEKYTVGQLIEAALVVSGNDAVTALAKHVGGTEEHFVEMMNDKCKALGLTNAHMVNPHGLTIYSPEGEVEGYNQMTAKEMFVLARSLLTDYPEILEITSMPSIKYEPREFIGYNTNPILGITEGIDGLKTGYTNIAGRAIIATGEVKGEGASGGMRLIGITLGSKGDWARYVAIKKLMEGGFANYVNEIFSGEGSIGKAKIKDGVPSEVDVKTAKPVSIIHRKDEAIKADYTYNEDLTYPMEEGDVVGKATYSKGGELLMSVDLVTMEEVSKPGIANKLRIIIRDIFRDIERVKAA